MTVLSAGFAERVFEFAFNAEYAHRHKAVLAGAPYIPTQNEEKWLGYDVEFSIDAGGGATHAVALQHKVARYVDTPSGSNEHFWNAVNAPYFAFRLDVEQYNLIHWLATLNLPDTELRYCAPLFVTKTVMDSHYLATNVEQNSIWIDVTGTGPLNVSEPHSIIYDGAGTTAFVFSEKPTKLKVIRPEAQRSISEQRASRRIDFPAVDNALRQGLRDYFKANPDRLGYKSSPDFKFPSAVPDELQGQTTASAGTITDLLVRYAGLSVLIETSGDV